jgi:hypothetical protein
MIKEVIVHYVRFQFERNSKFALFVVAGIATEIPPMTEFQLSDGTWVLLGVPVQDFHANKSL